MDIGENSCQRRAATIQHRFSRRAMSVKNKVHKRDRAWKPRLVHGMGAA
jgi:hypothetical protein